MSDFKNSTLRSHALDIQSQTGVKYTEALRQATKDLYVVDNSVEDYSDPAAWTGESLEYYDYLRTFDTLSSELSDVLPKLHTVKTGGVSHPWVLTREEDDSMHINPRTDVCYCFDVALVAENDKVSSSFISHDPEELSPRLYDAIPSFTTDAYSAQNQMVSLKSANHVVIYFESNWDDRSYIYSLIGLSLDEKKSALVELFNETIVREVLVDHLARCVKETKRNTKPYPAAPEASGLAALKYKE